MIFCCEWKVDGLRWNEDRCFDIKDSTIFSQQIPSPQGIKLIETKNFFRYNGDIDRLYYYY